MIRSNQCAQWQSFPCFIDMVVVFFAQTEKGTHKPLNVCQINKCVYNE